MMTSREIVSRAIHFRNPPRLPVTMGCFGVNDVGEVYGKRPSGWEPAVPGTDEWGCVWDKTEEKNMGQVKGHPLPDILKLSSFRPPDYKEASRYVDMAGQLDQVEAQGKYVMTGIFMVLFERMHTLHGFENTLVGLYEDRPAMEDLADMIVDTHVTLVQEISRRFPGRFHGWCMSDDWGTQTAAFVSFDMWMEFFFPRYKRIFDAMHKAGCDVWVHSCGKVNEILEGYIKAGVNVVNLQQPRALGIREIGERYRGRICFQSLADIQATLPTGDRRQVTEDTEQLMAHWATPEGGFVFSDYGDDAAIGVKDPGIKRFMYDEFSRTSKTLYGEALPAPAGPGQ
jgi:uroporphyrinogen decarboxylase